MTHPIVAYCERHRLSLHRFAVDLGVTHTTIYRLVRPKLGDRVRRPSAELMARVETFTKGEITMQALYAAHFGADILSMCPLGTKGKGEEQDSPSGKAA
jgi:hypothetical protein